MNHAVKQMLLAAVIVLASGCVSRGIDGETELSTRATPGSLDGTSWLFVEIDDRATELTGDLLRDDRYAVDFASDAFVGYGGCNRFSARYARQGDLLTATVIGSTRRACAEPFMSLERRLFEILSHPVRISFPDRRTMLLANATGTLRLRRTGDAE